MNCCKRYGQLTLLVLLCVALLTLGGTTMGLGAQLVKERARPTEVITEYIEIPVGGVMPYYHSIEMSHEERELLADIVFLESGNQSLTGQRCVVEVVFNRVLSPLFPNTVRGVLSQPNQFSTYKNIGIAKPTMEQYQAIDMTLAASEPILPGETLYFATSVANGTLYEQIGDHYFCT